MISLERFDLLQRGRSGLLSAHAREERFFFVRGMTLAADPEVVERRLDSICFFFGQLASWCTLCDKAKHVQELLDATMAVLQHSNWIVEPGVRLCAYLNSHSPSILDVFRCGELLLLCQSLHPAFRSDKGPLLLESQREHAPHRSCASTCQGSAPCGSLAKRTAASGSANGAEALRIR